jgi:hypothetical protein
MNEAHSAHSGKDGVRVTSRGAEGDADACETGTSGFNQDGDNVYTCAAR